MKRGTPKHPKTVDLASRLKIPTYQAVGILECLWHFTAEFAPQGNIGKFTDAAIAGHIHWERPCRDLIDALISSKWVERHSTHRLIVHDWHEHADQTVKRYLEKHGLNFMQSQGVSRKSRASTKLAFANENESADQELIAKTISRARTLPLPEPLPEPEPPAAPILVPLNLDQAIAATADRMYALHPKKKNLVLIPGALECAVAISPDPVGKLKEIESVHAEWSEQFDWTKQNGNFAPKLDEWIADRGFTQRPDARASPNQERPYVYTPPANLMTPARIAELQEQKRRHMEGPDAPA